MLDEEELADRRQNGGQKFADEVGHAEFGDEEEYQKLTKSVADEVDNEERQKTLPYFVFDFEVELTVQEETGNHSHLIADGVGQQLMHVQVCQQGENSYVNSGGHTADDTIQNEIAVQLILFIAKLLYVSHFMRRLRFHRNCCNY